MCFVIISQSDSLILVLRHSIENRSKTETIMVYRDVAVVGLILKERNTQNWNGRGGEGSTSTINQLSTVRKYNAFMLP